MKRHWSRPARYDPFIPPKPEKWLAMDESKRMRLAGEWHERAGDVAPGAELHATLHIIVENQIAMGDETPVRDVAARLMAEGLDRHETIHAIAEQLTNLMFDTVNGGADMASGGEIYYAALRKLTRRNWLEGHGIDPDEHGRAPRK